MSDIALLVENLVSHLDNSSIRVVNDLHGARQVVRQLRDSLVDTQVQLAAARAQVTDLTGQLDATREAALTRPVAPSTDWRRELYVSRYKSRYLWSAAYAAYAADAAAAAAAYAAYAAYAAADAAAAYAADAAADAAAAYAADAADSGVTGLWPVDLTSLERQAATSWANYESNK